MKRTWSTIGLVVVLVSLVFLGGCSKSASDEVPAEERQGFGKTYTFALNYPAGEYVMDMDVDMDQKMLIDGKKMNQTITMLMGMSMDVADHAPGEGFSTNMKFTRYKMGMVQQGRSLMDYDSDVPAKSSTEPLKTLFGGLLKLTIKMEFDKNGDILSATGMEKYLDLLAKDPAMSASLDAMKKQLSDKELARAAQASKAMLPPKPVTLDDTWPVVIDNGQGAMEGTARLVEVVSTPDGDLATIKMSGKVKGLSDMDGVDIVSSAIDFEGTIKLYVATGVMKTYVVDMDGSMSMRAQGTTVDMDMDGTVKMTMSLKK